MSKERDLLMRVKVLLECVDTAPLQDQADLAIKEIQELLQPEPEPEPVAWMWKKHTAGGWLDAVGLDKPSATAHQINIYPLYTAPPKREPLSEDVIWDNMPENPMECSALAFIRGVKFAEDMHGIGGGE